MSSSGCCVPSKPRCSACCRKASQALEHGDHEAVRHVVHTLKSSSASVGALELSRCCSEIENRLRAQQTDGLARCWRALNTEGQRVLAAVRALLAA